MRCGLFIGLWLAFIIVDGVLYCRSPWPGRTLGWAHLLPGSGFYYCIKWRLGL